MADYTVELVNRELIVELPGADLITPLVVRAETAADESEASAAASDMSKVLSEAASITAPDVYASTAAGLAAVAEGETFWAKIAPAPPTLYRKTGGVAVELDQLLTTATAQGRDSVDASDFATLQAAIDHAATRTPCEVRTNGLHSLTAGVTIPNGVTLNGLNGGLRATGAMTALVYMETGSRVINLDLDSNALATFAIRIRDASYTDVDMVTIRNWLGGILIENANHADVDSYECTHNRVTRTRIHTPASACIYPIRCASKRGKHIWKLLLDDVVVDGVAGAYGQPFASADQVSMQGIREFRINNVRSADGGELGMVVGQLSRDGIVSNCLLTGADADGIAVGGGSTMLTVDSVTGWANGDAVQGLTSGATGVVDRIIGTDVYLQSTVGFFAEGETVVNAIRLTMSTLAGIKEGDTLTGVTSGATGLVVRIADPESPTAPRQIYVKDAGAGDIDFTPTGEDVTNGVVTRTMTATNRDPAILTTTNHTLSTITRTKNVVVTGCQAYNNGRNANSLTLTFTTPPVIWSIGQTITGVTSGATAVIEAITDTTVNISSKIGTFTPGESITNGTNAYTLFYSSGIYAGVKVQQAENVRIHGGAYGGGNQLYGVYATQSPNLHISGPDLSGNLLGQTLFVGSTTLTASRELGDKSFDGLVAFPRGTLAYIASGVLNIDRSNMLVDVEGGVAATDDLVTISRADGEAIEDGTLLFLKAASSDRSIVVKATGGNIAMTGDVTLDHVRDSLALIYHAGPARWVRFNSDNAT